MVKNNNKKNIKVIPELYEAEEPTLKSKEDTLAELAILEAKEAAEDAKYDSELDDDEGVAEMTDAEMNAMSGAIAKKIVNKKNHGASKQIIVNSKVSELPKSSINKKINIIEASKCLLFQPPTTKEWTILHELKPKKIIFYYTMTKEEYKALFLMQVRYRSKIIGSTGARVI